jgi:hypothetical protein
MLRGKEAAPVRVHTIYLMFSGVERERDKENEKRETESIKNAKRGTSIVYSL